MERDERLDDQGFSDLANASGDLRWPLLERHFARGVVDSRAVVFFLSLTFFFLFLTLRAVESRRWK